MLKIMADVRPTLTLSSRASIPVTAEPVVKADRSGLKVVYQRLGARPANDDLVRVAHNGPTLETQPVPQSFRAAVADASYKAINLACSQCRRLLLSWQLQDADTVMISIGRNADHDEVGAALTISRALRFLGKTVDVCSEDELTASQRRFDPSGTIKRVGSLKGGDWDLAVVVDRSSKKRLGDAASLLTSAAGVIVVDHHKPPKPHDDLVSIYNTHATSYRDTSSDAASVQACAIAEQLLTGLELTPRQATYVFGPALAGIATDTGWGTHANLARVTAAVFKHVLQRANLTVGLLERLLHVDAPRELVEALGRANGLVSRDSANGLFMVQVSQASMQQLVKLGASHTPPLNERDIVVLLKSLVSAHVGHGTDCAALLLEGEHGAWSLIFRSRGQNAVKLATAFGGNGHDDAASGMTYGCVRG